VVAACVERHDAVLTAFALAHPHIAALATVNDVVHHHVDHFRPAESCPQHELNQQSVTFVPTRFDHHPLVVIAEYLWLNHGFARRRHLEASRGDSVTLAVAESEKISEDAMVRGCGSSGKSGPEQLGLE